MSDKAGSRSMRTYTARVGLDVDTPDIRVEIESLECTLLAEDLEFIDELVSAIIASMGLTLGVLVREEGTVCLHRRLRCQILQSGRVMVRDVLYAGSGRRTDL
jgi:hypothetical protein